MTWPHQLDAALHAKPSPVGAAPTPASAAAPPALSFTDRRTFKNRVLVGLIDTIRIQLSNVYVKIVSTNFHARYAHGWRACAAFVLWRCLPCQWLRWRPTDTLD